MSWRLFRLGFPAGVAIFFAALAGALLYPDGAAAHGLVGRSDLPIPDWLLVWGASLLLIGSFAALVLAWREPKFEQDSWRPVGETFSATVLNPAIAIVLGAISAGLLVLVIYSGFNGTEVASRNFSAVFVAVTFWLGGVGLSLLFGDVFRVLSPWRAIGRATSKLFAMVSGRRAPVPFEYPERLGRWPAVAGLVAYLYLENVWAAGSGGDVSPESIAIAATIYTGIQFAGMAMFGVDRWNDRGETFSVYFGMFASLSIFEVRDGRLGRRRPLSGSVNWAGPAGSLALVLVAIAGTTFDGAAEGTLKEPIASLFTALSDGGMGQVAAARLANTIYFGVTLAIIPAVFWLGIYGMRMVSTSRTAKELGGTFAHVFIPIAGAYLIAHYFSQFIFLEQAQFGYLLSDPLGDGTDLFGTANATIDYGVISATAIQWIQFGAVVIGHALALTLGHDKALATFKDPREASWSQIWMLVVTVMFSTLALYLLNQANA